MTLASRLRAKLDTLSSLPNIPSLAQQRERLQAEIDELRKSLARNH